MKVIVQAIKETTYYKIVVEDWCDNEPKLRKDNKISKKEVITIKEMEVDNNHILLNTFNYDDIVINNYKDEKVDGEFRIVYDLIEDTVYLKSDVCVELLEPNKDEMEKELNIKLRAWNKETIEKNEKWNTYCELHKLDKETVDIYDLKRLLPYNTGGIVFPKSIQATWIGTRTLQ